MWQQTIEWNASNGIGEWLTVRTMELTVQKLCNGGLVPIWAQLD